MPLPRPATGWPNAVAVRPPTHEAAERDGAVDGKDAVACDDDDDDVDPGAAPSALAAAAGAAVA